MQRISTSSLLLALATVATAQSVTSAVPPDPARSGLVRVRGAGFGDGTNASLTLSGVRVHIARWTDAFIELYVPEATPLGTNTLKLTAPGGTTDLTDLQVKERSLLPERFKWRFQAADQYITTRPAIGPDGSIYALGNYGHLYALSPDGALKWVWSGNVAGTVSVTQDGTIVCGGGGGIQAFSPAGQRLWTYAFDTPMIAGPNVGPDGNIYTVDNSRWAGTTLGAMVFNPSGQLIWSGGDFYNRGADYTPSEMVFDNENAYFTSGASSTNGTPGLTSIALGGGIRWVNPDGVGRQPSGMPGGVALVGSSTIDKWTSAGSRVWSRSLWDFGGVQTSGDLVALSDGSVYTLLASRRLVGFAPNGATRLNLALDQTPSWLTARPDQRSLLLQTMTNFGEPFRIRSYSVNGTLEWTSEELPIELGMTISIYNRMVVTPDSSTFYFGTSGPMISSDAANSYLYAGDAAARMLAESFQTPRGVLVSGGLAELRSSDNQKLLLRAGPTASSSEAPEQLVVNTVSPLLTPSEIRVRVEAKVTTGNIAQRVELWDWDASRYVQVDSRPATLIDSVAEVTVPGGAAYVDQSTGQVRARISWKAAGPTAVFPWRAEIDRPMWLIR